MGILEKATDSNGSPEALGGQHERKNEMRTRRIIMILVAAALAVSAGASLVCAQEKNIDQKSIDQKSIDQRLEELEQEIRTLKHQRELDQEQAAQKAEQATKQAEQAAQKAEQATKQAEQATKQAEQVTTQAAQQAEQAAQKAEEAAKKAKEMPVLVAGENGFGLKSADGNFVLRLRGYAQADERFYFYDKANNKTDAFLLRRVRPILEGTLFRDFDFRIMTDFGNGAAAANLLQDAYLEWKYWPWLKVRAGKYKPPVGLEQLQQDTWLFFAERGLPSDLVPNRDVGIQVSGDLFGGVVSYAGGIFNGVVDGGIADTDTWDSKDGAARIFIQPFKKTDMAPLKGLGFGVGGTIGKQFTGTTTNLPTYKTTGQNTFFSFNKGVAPAGLSLRGTPQAYYYWGPLGLFGEYVISEQDLSRSTHNDYVRNSAWQAQASFVLTGENATYGGVTPRHPFDPKKGGWGAFEIVGRYGDLHIDPTAFSGSTTTRFADPTTSAQEAREWGIGLNWYLNKNVKLLIDYEQTVFDGGAGTALNVQDRETERVLITRAQFTF